MIRECLVFVGCGFRADYLSVAVRARAQTLFVSRGVGHTVIPR